MKDVTVTLMSIMVSLLLVRYYPNISGKLLLEYIKAEYLSFRSGKFINDDIVDSIRK